VLMVSLALGLALELFLIPHLGIALRKEVLP
jgi:hypothetical protein